MLIYMHTLHTELTLFGIAEHRGCPDCRLAIHIIHVPHLLRPGYSYNTCCECSFERKHGKWRGYHFYER